MLHISPMSKKYALDINGLMDAVDRNDYGYLSRQSEDARKAFSPRVALRYTSSASKDTEHYIVTTNAFANRHFDKLNGHPDLQFRLLCMSGSGRVQRHNWLALPKPKAKTDTIFDFLWDCFPKRNQREINLILSTITNDEFIQILDQSGCSEEDHKTILAAWKKRRGPQGS